VQNYRASFRHIIATSFPPEAEKTIRHFSPTETASLIGIHEGYLRQVAAEGKGVSPSIKNGRRSYSVDAIQEIRKQLDQGARGGRRYLPHRGSGEHLQVITVMNFKGGSDWPALAQKPRHQTRNNARHVIVTARRMPNNITRANTRRTALQCRELLNKPLVVQ